MSDSTVRPPHGLLTRRQFLYVSGGVLATASIGGVLAACSGGASPSPTAAPTAAPTTAPTAVPTSAATAAPSAAACPSVTPITGTVGGPFNMNVWQGYEGVGIPVWDKWYADHGIQPSVKYISEPNIIATFKSPAGAEFDASSLNQGDVPNAYAAGICMPISVEEVPGIKKMYSFFQDSDFWKLCDGVYSAVPWQWGPISIVTRRKEVPVGTITSLQDVLDPKWTGKVGIFDDALNTISTGAIATGNDPGKLTRDQLNGPVKDWLKRLVPQLKTLSASLGDQTNVLASGDVLIMLVGWAYMVPSLASQQIDADFIIPKEGAYGFADSLFIPPTAPHKATLLAWINAMMEGDTAVAVNDYSLGFSTSPDVNAKLAPETLAPYGNPNIETYLAQTKFNRSWSDPNGPYATIDEWNQVWNAAKAGTA